MKRIAFLDNTYPRAYQSDSIGREALGGTESSIIRTAQILSQNHQVMVAQKSRTEPLQESKTLSFAPKTALDEFQPDVIVVLRKYPLLRRLRQQFPHAKLCLWLHTYKPLEFGFKRLGLIKTQTTVICNSQTHAQHIDQRLHKGWTKLVFGLTNKVPITYCYNPIPQPQTLQTKRNLNQLVYLSSPNKGLPQVLKCFEYLQKHLPELKLLIANPGYKNHQQAQSVANIEWLGSLPHEQMMQILAESLCVFYPQNTFAETFGLIYAEANSYGTPVLAHDIGAAKEILHSNNPLVDVTDYQQVLSVIKNWQKTFPQVAYKQQFATDSILQQWQAALGL